MNLLMGFIVGFIVGMIFLAILAQCLYDGDFDELEDEDEAIIFEPEDDDD